MELGPTDNRALRDTINGAIQNQPYSTVTALSSLLAIQDALGYLPAEAMEEVAAHTGTTTNDVWGIASFYLNFRFSPPGEHMVEVCWGPTCHIGGAMTLLDGLLSHLGMDHEGDTSDGKMSLKLNTCLGACPHAPVICVDGKLMGSVSLDEASSILDEIRNGNPES